ncbi:variant leucine-rich repeat-containing protein [Glaciibacter psychrotolerans]
MNHQFYSEAAHPLTAQVRLAELASAYPELHPVIADNPACYPGLLEWMRSVGTLPDVVSFEAAAASVEPAAPTQPVAHAGDPFGQPAWQSGQQPDPFGRPASPYGQPGATGGAVPGTGIRRTKPWIIGGAIALVVLLAGGGAWAYAGIFSKLGGASSPQAAVSKLLNGAAELDMLSIYGSLSPAEVGSFKAAVEKLGTLESENEDGTQIDYQKTLERAMKSMSVSMTDLEFDTEEIAEGIATVALTAGELRVDADADALLDTMFEAVRPQLVAQYESFGYDSDAIDLELERTRASAADDLTEVLPYSLTAKEVSDELGRDFTLVTVNEGGSWYVSPLLSLGEMAFQQRGDNAKRGKLVAASAVENYATPEEAVGGLATAVAKFVQTGRSTSLAAALPLAERRFVSLYGETWGAGINGSTTVDIGDVDVSAVESGGVARIELDNLSVYGNSGSGQWQVDLSGICAVADFGYSDSRGCLDDIPVLDKLGASDIRLIAVKEGSGWFVSPLRTASDIAAIAAENLAGMSKDGSLNDLLAGN